MRPPTRPAARRHRAVDRLVRALHLVAVRVLVWLALLCLAGFSATGIFQAGASVAVSST